MRVTAAGLLIVLLSGLSIGCGKGTPTSAPGTPTPAPSPTGSPSLDGTYLLTKVDFGPLKMTAEELAKDPESERTVVIKGDKLTHGMKKKPETWTIKLDAGKTPHEITATETLKDGKTEEYLGIYQVEGNTLTIHFAMENKKERPKSFNPTEDTWLMVMKKK